MLVLKGRKLNGRAWLVSAAASIQTGGNSTAMLTSSTAFDQRRVFNRDVYAGNPPGFSTTYDKGWGAVSVTVTPSSAVSTGLWLRLHDASDSAAQPNVSGSGAVLQSPVQVAG